jgi:hypothetical protein
MYAEDVYNHFLEKILLVLLMIYHYGNVLIVDHLENLPHAKNISHIIILHILVNKYE